MWPFFLSGQIAIDFENGLPGSTDQYPANHWGVTSDDPLSGTYSLKHSFDNQASACDMISFGHDEIQLTKPVSWEFMIRYPLSPSSSNNWAVFLMSEKPAAFMTRDAQNRALIVGVNYTSSDDILKLYLQDDQGIKVLCNTDFNWEEQAGDQAWRFRIAYLPGQPLVIQTGTADKTFTIIGEADVDSEALPVAEYFGLMYAYTASRDRMLTFDDLRIGATFIRDSLPPGLNSISFPKHDCLEFHFNEAVYPGENFDLLVNQTLVPDSLSFNGNELLARFDADFANGLPYTCELSDVSDRKGNVTNIADSFVFFFPGRNDVILTEIMADPSPPVYLPECEYIEIYNRSTVPVNLKGWTLSVGSREFLLPELELSAGQYHLICSEEGGKLYPPGKCSTVFTSSSLLTNTGQFVVLRNQLGEIIDAVTYSNEWYGDQLKAEGGWSLERIDRNFFCGNVVNWTASEAPEGGSPAAVNSVDGQTLDNDLPYIRQIIFDSTGYYRLVFNEPVSLLYDDTDSIFVPLGKADFKIAVQMSELYPDTLKISFPAVMENEIIALKFCHEIEDCSGNRTFISDSLLFGKPSMPAPSDIIFTEVLYSPFPGCAEFAEIYNRSGRILSLRDLKTGISGNDGSEIHTQFLSEDNILLYPRDYLAVSTNPESLHQFYDVKDEGSLFRLPGLHSFDNEGGILRLMDRSGMVIDEMSYTPDQQFPMLTDDHGISLERMTLDNLFGILAPWHSASSLSGFATPGYQNSQFIGESRSASSFTIDSEIFTPDNDGVDDVAVFRYHFDRAGYVGTFLIFDPSGRRVRTVGSNELLGAEGYFTWDGKDGSGRLCSIGIYLGYFEAFHLSGRKQAFKQTVVLAKGRD